MLKVGEPITFPPSPTVRRGRPPNGSQFMTKAEYRRRYREREKEQRPTRKEEERELGLEFGNVAPFDERRGDVRGESETARAIEMGLCWLLRNEGCLVLRELILPSGRRPDVVALRANGEIWIIEIKSSRQDFKDDKKWPDYHDFCHRLFFAITPNMKDVFPKNVGIIRANSFGGSLLRTPSRHRPIGAHNLKACIRTRILQMIRRKELPGSKYERFVTLTQRDVRPHLLAEWSTLPPEQRRTIQQAKKFARDASKRYLFRSRKNRHELVLDWIRSHSGL